MAKTLLHKLKESVLAVLPITVLVIIIALTLVDISLEIIALFMMGAVFLIVGMSLFTLGSDISMMPIGQSVGSFLSRAKKRQFPFVILIALVIGFIITIAEPDLMVLANQLNPTDGINYTILFSVAIGVGIFLVISVLRTFFNIKLKYLLLGSYSIVFAIAIATQIVNPDFVAIAFDSGGVTTGPITVPFIMALGIGLAVVRKGDKSSDDSFGMVALCSVGPILAVFIVGLMGVSEIGVPQNTVPFIETAGDFFAAFGHGLVDYIQEVAIALIPIIAVFLIFQIFFLKLPKTQIIRISIGILHTFLGLSLFLTGVNIGFMPMGKLIGQEFALKSYSWLLVPIGMVMGALIVLAEPAVHVLTKQVEEITGGAISKKVMTCALCLAIAVAVGLAMFRELLQLNIFYFIVPVYVISLVLMFFVPPIFTGIAFDSGGVASGPMTATFLLPFAIGIASALNINVYANAFGLVAFVAMTPLITVQIVGLIFKIKSRNSDKNAELVTPIRTISGDNEFRICNFDGEIIDFDGETEYGETANGDLDTKIHAEENKD